MQAQLGIAVEEIFEWLQEREGDISIDTMILKAVQLLYSRAEILGIDWLVNIKTTKGILSIKLKDGVIDVEVQE